MRSLAFLICALAAWAATPLVGTWKLNRQKSTVAGPLPSFIHAETMDFPAAKPVTVEVPPAHFLVQDPSGEKNLYRVDVSADQRTLTVRQVQSFEDQTGKQFRTVLVLEKP